jgi:DNA-binding LacI/PurR family transcriptional regulator
MAGIKDVAARAGVSISTVSRVFNGHENISDEKRKAVLEAADVLGYSANSLAASLRSKSSNVVGVLLASQGSPFGTMLHTAIGNTLSDRGYLPMVCSTLGEDDRQDEYVRTLLEMQVGGVIIRPSGSLSITTRHAANLEREGVPVVFVESAPRKKSVSFVVSANKVGGQLAIRRLWELGHRKIGIMIMPCDVKYHPNRPVSHRLEGALETARELDIADGIVLSPDMPGERFDYGYMAAKRMLREHPELTAIFAMTDMMGTGALYAARETGLSVPEDISVLGYDGLPLSEMTFPPMATVSQSVDLMGQTAADLLINRLEGSETKSVQRTLNPHLIERESLAPVPKTT